MTSFAELYAFRPGKASPGGMGIGYQLSEDGWRSLWLDGSAKGSFGSVAGNPSSSDCSISDRSGSEIFGGALRLIRWALRSGREGGLARAMV